MSVTLHYDRPLVTRIKLTQHNERTRRDDTLLRDQYLISLLRSAEITLIFMTLIIIIGYHENSYFPFIQIQTI